MTAIKNFDIGAAVLLDDIPKDGLDLYYDDVTQVLHESGLPEGQEPISGEAHLSRSNETVHLKGMVKGRLALLCDRCLERYFLDVSHTFSYLLMPSGAQRLKPELSLSAEDVDTTFYEGGLMPLQTIFREQILLEIPIRGLCSDGCKGLCPGCGVNLNLSPCQCEAKEPEGPFAVLKGLLH